MDLAEKYGADVWLQHNKSLENMAECLSLQATNTQKEVQVLNYSRKVAQDSIRDELSKMIKRRDDAIYKSWQIEAHCNQMEQTLGNTLEHLPKRARKSSGHEDG